MLGGCNTLRETLELHGGQQHLVRACGIAQSGRHVDGRTDVVVAFEQQGMTRGDTHAERERCAYLCRTLFEFEREGDAVLLFDRHDHAAVAEPLRDANAALAGDLTRERPKRAEQPTGGVVTERGRVVGEAGEIGEREGAGDTHQPYPSSWNPLREGIHKLATTGSDRCE